jgi:hypothetical protein
MRRFSLLKFDDLFGERDLEIRQPQSPSSGRRSCQGAEGFIDPPLCMRNPMAGYAGASLLAGRGG